MIQRSLWKRPALQTSEAVLLPAMPRMKAAEPVYSDGYQRVRPTEDPFRPVETEENSRMALSAYVRPRGSMAGRSVLRAVGIGADPYLRRRTETGWPGRMTGRFADGKEEKRQEQRLSLFRMVIWVSLTAQTAG